jgi:ABC-type polysaccharide/polyol phosphate export permease
VIRGGVESVDARPATRGHIRSMATNAPPAPGLARSFAGPLELWRYRELLRSLTSRNLKVKYQRSTLGFLWTLLNPLVTGGVLVLVFGYVVRIPVPDYWAFLLSGWFAWSFLQYNLSSATYVLGAHGALRRSVAFPDEILILASAISRLAEYGIEMLLVLIALVAFHHHSVPSSFVLVPVLVVLLVLLAIGLMLPLATLSVFYTDVQHALPAALLTLFYVSPVFYPVSLVPEHLRPLMLFNPIAPLLTLHHVVLFEGRWPSPELLGAASAASVILFLLGYAIFNRYKSVYAEIV